MSPHLNPAADRLLPPIDSCTLCDSYSLRNRTPMNFRRHSLLAAALHWPLFDCCCGSSPAILLLPPSDCCLSSNLPAARPLPLFDCLLHLLCQGLHGVFVFLLLSAFGFLSLVVDLNCRQNSTVVIWISLVSYWLGAVRYRLGWL